VARIEAFDEVTLDYAGVRRVGQAFADEIYRVFASEHPRLRLVTVNAAQEIQMMIRRVRAPLTGEPRG
jgi:hypothetical protein